MAILIFLSGSLPIFVYRNLSSILSSLVYIFAVHFDFSAVYTADFMRILALGLARVVSSSPIVLKRLLNVRKRRLCIQIRWGIWRRSRRGISISRNVKGLVFYGRCKIWAVDLLIFSGLLKSIIVFIYLEVLQII